MSFPWPYYEGFKNIPSERGERQMQHNLKISLGREPDLGGIVQCKTVSMRERVLRCLFGDTRRITVIVPGGSVRALSVQEVPEVDGHECG